MFETLTGLVSQAQEHTHVLELIARGRPAEESLTALLHWHEKSAPGLRATILLLDDDGQTVRHLAAPSMPQSWIDAVNGQQIGPRAGACGTAAYTQTTVICADIATDPLWSDYLPLAVSHGIRAAWSVPIVDANQLVIGTFACYLTEARRPTPLELRLTEAAAQIASIAIVRDREVRRLRDSETALNEAQHLAQTGSWEWDIERGTGHWSREMFTLTGLPYASRSPTFDTFLAWVHPDDRQ